MSDLLAVIAVLIILGAVVIIAKLCSKRLNPEMSRKTIHIVMGCTALTFPYIFKDWQPVVYLGIAAVIALLLLRKNEFLRKGVGTALLGVQRKSLGDIYFVISIVIVFVLHKSVIEYLIPIAVLTFADSVAALIGTSYGRHNLSQHDEEAAKSREGSVMFFIVAFICTLVPLQLMTGVGRAEVLLISFLIGFLAAMIEAVTWNGNDNLLLPILTHSFLRYNVDRSLDFLFVNFGYMLLLLAAIYIVCKLTNFTGLSIAYSLLVAYLLLMQGDIMWLVPPFTLFFTFGILPVMKDDEKNMMRTYRVIECNTIVGVTCIVLAALFPAYREILYISFSLSFAIHLSANTFSRLFNFQKYSVWISMVGGSLKSVLFIAVPTLFTVKMPWIDFVLYIAVLLITMPFTVLLNRKYDYKNFGDDTFRADKILVGTGVVVFTAILLLIRRFYDIY